MDRSAFAPLPDSPRPDTPKAARLRSLSTHGAAVDPSFRSVLSPRIRLSPDVHPQQVERALPAPASTAAALSGTATLAPRFLGRERYRPLPRTSDPRQPEIDHRGTSARRPYAGTAHTALPKRHWALHRVARSFRYTFRSRATPRTPVSARKHTSVLRHRGVRMRPHRSPR